jgi:hypothetical protein
MEPWKAGGRLRLRKRRAVLPMLGDCCDRPRALPAGARSPNEEWMTGLRDMDRPERAPELHAVANFRFVTPHYWKAWAFRRCEAALRRRLF